MFVVKCPSCGFDIINGSVFPGTKVSLTCGNCQASMIVTNAGVALRSLAVPTFADLDKVRTATVKDYGERYEAYALARIAEYRDNMNLVNARCQKVLDKRADEARRERERHEAERLAKTGVKAGAFTGKAENKSDVPTKVIFDMLNSIIDLRPDFSAEVKADYKRRITTLSGCREVGAIVGIRNF